MQNSNDMEHSASPTNKTIQIINVAEVFYAENY